MSGNKQPSISSAKSEFGQSGFRCDIIPDNCRVHAASDFLRIAFDDVRQEVWSFIQLHNGNHIWEIVRKPDVIRDVIYGIRIDGSMTAGNDPLEFPLITFRADDGGWP